eukprot:6336819-Pyramimonas_sp.AAC.1
MAERKIPTSVFSAPLCPQHFQAIHAAERKLLHARGDGGDTHEEWAAAKRAMVSAAKAARNHVLTLPDLQLLPQGAELNALAMRSAAR